MRLLLSKLSYLWELNETLRHGRRRSERQCKRPTLDHEMQLV